MNGSNTSRPRPPAEATNGHHHAALSPEGLIELLRSLADPIRLRILRLLESAPRGTNAPGLSVGELSEILKLPQSTVSRHLKTLVEAQLAEPRRDGTSAFYRLAGGANPSAVQLRQLASTSLAHDSLAKNDGHRLTAVLRKRQSPADFFGRHAPQWDQLRARWFGETFHLEAMLALLDPHWVVADIGTGTGAMLPLLSPHVQRVIAIDPNAAMLKNARQRVREQNLGNVELLEGSAEHLPLAEKSVDVALLALVLTYAEEPTAVFREARRVLKAGGVLLVIDLQPHEVAVFKEKLNQHWNGFSREQITAWLAGSGFADVRWHPIVPRKSRENGEPVPDLFVLRAEAGGVQ